MAIRLSENYFVNDVLAHFFVYDVLALNIYYVPKPVSAAVLVLMRQIDELHLEHPFMGARMLRDQLVRKSFRAGRKHVSTLMKRMGIEALYRKTVDYFQKGYGVLF